MTKTEQTRYNVLNRLKEMFESVETAAVLRETEGDFQMPMLLTLHDNIGYQGNEVMGEFYFLPLGDKKQKFHYFCTVMTLEENVPPERYDELAMAATMLNFYLPAGAFVLEKGGGVLAYKYTSLLPWDGSEDELLSLADGGIGAALNLTNNYGDAFINLMNRKITLEEFERELPDAHFV